MPEGERFHHLGRYGVIAAAVALAVVATGIGTRLNADRRLAAVARDNGVPSVSVIRARPSASTGGLDLPGTVQAFNSAPIYARTNGYVRRWLVDIGDQVSAGQTLAVLDDPEVDQQLAQARAAFKTAAANAALARTTATRWSAMLAKDAVSQQEADEKRGDLIAKLALVDAQAANVRRLGVLRGFTRLTAPFAGVVTSRSAQIGALVVAGTAASQPLFTVSDVHRMRIYVRAPESLMNQMTPGTAAAVTVPQFADRTFRATLMRTAGAVEGASGSVLVELQADNADRALRPGSYASVHFPLAATGRLSIPASALLVRTEGTQVATVDVAGRVRLKRITIAVDEGAAVQVGIGLTGTERIIDNPPDVLAEGDAVRVQPTPRASRGGPR